MSTESGPRTQAQGSLQPPGRVPPVATGIATPPPPGKRPPGRSKRARKIGGWVVSYAPMPVMLVSAVYTVAAPTDDARVTGFLVYTVSIFLIGLFMGLGRYRTGEYIKGVQIPLDDRSRAELIRDRARRDQDPEEAA